MLAKRCFVEESINRNKGNPEEIWRALKTLSGVKKEQVIIKELNAENGTITNKQEIAEKINDAFINIVSCITSSDQCVAVFDGVALTEFVKPKLGNHSFEIPDIYNCCKS